MTARRALVAALAAGLVAACGGQRRESRQGGEGTARREERERRSAPAPGVRGRGQPEGDAETMRGAGGQGDRGTGGQERRAPGNESRMAASPEALLGRQEVARVQQALAGKGLLGEHRQGELDGPTTEAVSRFQQQRGLAATGVPDRETLRELDVSAERAYGPERRSRG